LHPAVSFLSLSTDPVTQAFPDQSLAVSGDATVGEVLQLMRTERGSCVLICSDEGALEGIFTERDALRCTMAEGGYRHLPIVDEDGVPQGVLAVRGIVHYLVDHFPNTVYNLPPDPSKSFIARDGA
jgi:CBS domain-containing protein